MFAVKWSSSASGDFLECMILHPNRSDDIDEAADVIDEMLRTDPMGNGQHLSEDLWRVTSKPLAVYFTVDGYEVGVSSVGWIEP